MKRITKVYINNCRAYFSQYAIELPIGENLLIYGENGAGKSSLFKSFNSFFKNSISQQDFSSNLYNISNDGEIELTFSELDDDSRSIISSVSYKFSNVDSNNNVTFIKESSLLNGFLDYTDLLKIYLKSEPNPNLFDLIILNLLNEFIPVTTGNSTTLGSQYVFLIKNLITDSRTRNSRCHKLGLTKIADFEVSLRSILTSIFELVNGYLSKYFDLKDIKIEYVLKNISFIYPNHSRSSWFLDTDLRLNVLKNGSPLGNEYKDYLNEARLSSVAICLYLASLKLFPNQIEYKLIYLDDIFIGLDTSNRIPIINILNEEFQDYQIIISTYDKNFFDVCKNKLSANFEAKLWKAIELYVGEFEVNGKYIDVPIVLNSNDDLDKARYYLYNNDNPDYPASANYFRKYLEKKLKKVFPHEIFRNSDLEEIESYKLSKIFNICKQFLENCNIQMKPLKEINSYLFILLHPLSHYNTSINTYKKDLKEIDKNIKLLFESGSTAKTLSDIKFCTSKSMTIRVEFFINQYSIMYYEFYLTDFLFYDNFMEKFSTAKVICTKYYGIKNKNQIAPKTLNKNTSKIFYSSIEESYEEISKLINGEFRFYKKKDNIFEFVKYFDGVNWVNFKLK